MINKTNLFKKIIKINQVHNKKEKPSRLVGMASLV